MHKQAMPRLLPTTIAGSLPKPSWLADTEHQLAAPWVVPSERLSEAIHDAVRLALHDQESAGIDIVTDGEQGRRHYIWAFLEGLTGVDTHTTTPKVTRGERATPQNVARIVGDVTRPSAVMLEALHFTQAHTGRPVKVALPGPMTLVDSTVDEYYREDPKTLAFRWAKLLNAEARDLDAAGASVIQFDEPCFTAFPREVEEWGVDALEVAAAGVSCEIAVHVCYSYGIPAVLEWKARNTKWDQYSAILPLLAKSSIHQLSVECAASKVDISVLANAGDKDVLLGVIDVGTEAVETPEVVATRIRAALPYVSPERLYPCTDCGLVPRSRAAALGKLRALADGAAIVRRELV